MKMWDRNYAWATHPQSYLMICTLK